MSRGIYYIYQGLAWILFAGLLVQFFLAGLGVFRAATFRSHRTLGDVLIYASVVLLILAVASLLTGNLDRWKVGLTALLVVLLLLQYLLATDSLQAGAPFISALHPLNGVLLVFISYVLAHGHDLPWAAQTRVGRGATARSDRV
ncbi:MAG: hypothetical protein JOZ19_05550 [Rubrobacter sp.]|nr:hypothetical protein [Rubrobacter sp.]